MVISSLEAVKLDRKIYAQKQYRNSAALPPKARLLKLLSHRQPFVRNEGPLEDRHNLVFNPQWEEGTK